MKLNDDFREVIVLRDIQQLTYEEIAEITDTAMGTVKSRINRARQQLQSLIGDYVNSETI
jgi:RNA polymerase sigma-70 factor (ECF subfamily)